MIEPQSGLAKLAMATDPESLAECYGNWLGIRTNHVVTVDGLFKDSTGSSRGISSPNDLKLMLAQRKFADLLLVDSATARNEGYRPSNSKWLAIVSQTGNFSGLKSEIYSSEKAVFFGPSDTAWNVPGAFRGVKVGIRNENPFGEISDWAKIRLLNQVLVEAGPKLTKRAFEEGLVRQSSVTFTSPSGLDPNYIPANPWDARARLVSLARETDAVYTLWEH